LPKRKEAAKPMDDKEREHFPFFWGIVVVILGVTGLFLWHWYSTAP
jgi:hypothetical protein